MPEECQEAKDLKLMLLKGVVNQAVLKERARITFAVSAWLGYWRDKMPAEAVASLQTIVDPTPSEGQITKG